MKIKNYFFLLQLLMLPYIQHECLNDEKLFITKLNEYAKKVIDFENESKSYYKSIVLEKYKIIINKSEKASLDTNELN